MPSLRSLLGRRASSPSPRPLPRRTGLNVLYDPRTQGSEVSMDIVFVHGLNGHYIHTWEESSVCWPRDLLPSRMENARVLSFSYDADIYNSASVGRIRDHGLNLLAHLIAKRPRAGRESSTRPIVFVAHSLGGLLVKEALREARQHSDDMGHQAILAATRGFVFFSTPHGGSTPEAWLRIASGFGPLSSLGRGRGRISPLVQALQRDAPNLHDLAQDFRHIVERYALISLYETEPYVCSSGGSSSRSASVIVDKVSALTHLPHEVQLAIPASHTNMCRFACADDAWFKTVVRRIEQASLGRNGCGELGLGPGTFAGEAVRKGLRMDDWRALPSAEERATGMDLGGIGAWRDVWA